MEESRLGVVVCDDDAQAARRLADYVRRLCAELGAGARVMGFEDSSLLLESWPADVDLLFLDMEMPLVDGMTVAREVRARNQRLPIVFVTSYDRYAVQGYEVGAYRYLLKPLSYERFRAEVGPLVRQVASGRSHRLCLRRGGSITVLHADEISFVETCAGHVVRAHACDGRCAEGRGTIAQVADELGGGFFRCHTSYLVNLAHVVSLEPDEVRLADGAVVPVSRHRRRALREALLAFLGDVGA